MKRFLHYALVLLFTSALTACGGGGGGGGLTTQSSGNTTTAVGTVAFSVGATSVTLDDQPGAVLLTATVADSTATVMSGTSVTFRVSGKGSLSSTTSAATGTPTQLVATTDSAGVATAYLIPGTVAGTSTVYASSGGVNSASTAITLNAGVPSAVNVSASPATVQPGSASTLTANVVDQFGNSVGGETVIFSITTDNSGGQLSASSGTTSTDVADLGQASVTYTTGLNVGTDTITVKVASDTSITNTVNVDANSSGVLVGGVTLAAGSSALVAGSGMSGTMRATVTDVTNTTLPGRTVTFTTTLGTFRSNGLSSVDVVSGVNGVADAELVVGNAAGTAVVTASTSGFTGVTSVLFDPGVASSIAVTGNPATIPPGGSTTLTATVTDSNGNAVAGQVVSFAVVTNTTSGSLSATEATSDTYGRAQVVYTSGSAVGTDTITATLFNNNAVIGAANIVTNSDNVQGGGVTVTNGSASLVTGSGDSGLIRATVRDTSGNLLPGRDVEFSTTLGTFSNSSNTITVTSGAGGIADAYLQVGTTMGVAQVTARADGFSDSTNVTFAADVPDAVAVSVSPNPVAPSSPTTVIAKVTDQYGNPVENELVSFAVTTNNSGGSFGSVSAVTDINGNAIVTYSAGAVPATDTVTATATSQGVAGTQTVHVTSGGSVVGDLKLLSSSTTLLTGGTDTVTLTAFVKSIDNVLMSGTEVTFTADQDGSLTIDRATTDASGTAVATLSTPGNPVNRTIQVTATAGSLTQTVDIVVTGNQLTVSGPSSTTLGTSLSYDLFLQDAAGQGISGQTVTAASQLGNGIAASAVTDSSGHATITVSADVAGQDTLSFAALGAQAAYTVNVDGDQFVFDSPAAGTEVPLNTVQTLTVQWIQGGNPVVGGVVKFTATRGTLISSQASTGADGKATVSIQSDNSGPSLITAYVSNGPAVQQSIEFVATVPEFLTLQASPSTLDPGGDQSTITAVVRDANHNPVKNQTVLFSVSGTSGGTLSTGASAVTDSYGRASAVYVSGNASTGADGVQISASVYDATNNRTINDTIPLTVAGKALFISFGTGNTVSEVSSTQIAVPYTLLVTDSNGNAVPGVQVSLSVLPTLDDYAYAKGYFVWDAVQEVWVQVPTAQCYSEDRDRDGLFDPTVDVDENNNGKLEPGNNAAIDQTVTTDSTGVAQFQITYPKEYAYWIQVDIIARAALSAGGSETERLLSVVPPGLAGDYGNKSVSPPGAVSPFGTATSCATLQSVSDTTVGGVSVTSGATSVRAGSSDSSVIRAYVVDTSGNAVEGSTVNFSTNLGSLVNNATDRVPASSAVTNTSGIAEIYFIPGTTIGTARVTGSMNGFSATGTLEVRAGEPSAGGLTLTASPTVVRPLDTTTLSAHLVDDNGNPISGRQVRFAITTNASGANLGAIVSGYTNVNGDATLTYTAGNTAGTDVITATLVDDDSVTTSTALSVDSTATVVYSAALTAGAASITADGSSEVAITAHLFDELFDDAPGVTVNFSTSLGTIVTPTVTTSLTGYAVTKLRSSTSTGTATVTAEANGVVKTVNVSFVAGAPANVSVVTTPSTVAPGKTTAVTATVTDANGNPVSGETLTYSVTTNNSGGALVAYNTVTDSGGQASLTYTTGTASADSGTDKTDTLKVVADSNGTSGTGTVTTQNGAVSVGYVYVQAGSLSITADGASSTTIRATIRDASGAVAPGATVSFTSTLGSLSAASATANDSGIAEVTLDSSDGAGGVATVGTATVTATASGFSDTTTVGFVAGAPATVSVVAAPSTVAPDGLTTVTATVTDANGNPVSSELVNFMIATDASGGALIGSYDYTDNFGRAVLSYRAGTTVGTDTIRATATSNSSTGTANVVVATGTVTVGSVFASTGASSIVADGTSQVAIRATVYDSSGNLAQGVTVSFSQTLGVLSAATATTDANGVAEVLLTAATAGGAAAPVGTSTVYATASGFVDTVAVNFVAGPPATVTVAASPNTVNPGNNTTVSATVTDSNGYAVVGEAVNFTVSGNNSGGTLFGVTAYTNAVGVASVTYTAGTTSGVNDTFTATTASNSTSGSGSVAVAVSSVSVGSVSMTAGASAITADGTSSTVIRAIVRDTSGVLAEGVSVSFSGTLGTLSSGSVTTNSSGIAEVTLTADDGAGGAAPVGTSTITASALGVHGSASVAFVAGVPAAVNVAIAPNVINPNGSVTVKATVTDSNGYSVVGETVNFSVTTNNSSGSLGSISAITNANGEASVTYVAGSTAGGVDTITATASSNNTTGTANVSVDATATVVASVVVTSGASSISADGSSTALIRATVTDIDGNPASGLTVGFATSLGSVSSASVTSDANGIAETTLQAGTTAGTATVTVTAHGFTATTDVVFQLVPVPSTITIGTSSTSVSSDNSDTATITATVLDANRAALSGVSVSFSASAGMLSNYSVTTGSDGKATVTFASGTDDPTNRTATITAAVANLTPVQIPVQIAGSTVSISADTTALVTGGADTATLTITAANAGGTGVYGADVAVSVSGGTGSGNLTVTSDTTNVSGKVVTQLQATGTGTIIVTAQALGATATKTFTVTGVATAMQITTPAANPTTIGLNTAQAITVTAPNVATTNINFASSLGELYAEPGGAGTGCAGVVYGAGGTGILQVPVDVGTREATACLIANASGTATVEAYDANDSTSTDRTTVLVAADTVDATSTISLQASSTTVPLSSSGTANTVTLTAEVRTSANQPISGAAVVFSISNSTGGGEYLTPAYGVTDASGQVTTTFASGSRSSGAQGVTVTATLYDASFTSAVGQNDSVAIVINQTANSVVIGTGTTVSDYDSATYSLPMSVLVADSAGNAVAGAQVTLKVWPKRFRTGYWYAVYDVNGDIVDYVPAATYAFDNEDANKNGVLDAGEDKSYSEALVAVDLNNDGDTNDVAPADGLLTPASSAAGSLVQSVTTDANGIANFNLNYQKQYSVWIEADVTATTEVLGTETSSTLTFTLPYAQSDASPTPGLLLSDSPFNPPIN